MPVRRFACLLTALALLMTAAAASGDPYIWLEQVHGPRPDAWVAAENKRSLAVLESDPRYPAFRDDALRILEATDRVPLPNQIGRRITNLWQDATNVQGLWRETTPADYLKPEPRWTTLLDLDKLSAAEGVKWVWHGANCEPVEEQRCLVNLSAGGEDAVTVREYDLNSRRFVPDGFTLSTAKQEIGWETPDRLLIAREWGPDTLTKSGYPFVVKRLQRGAPLASAVEIYRGQANDQVGVYPVPLVDGDGHRLTLLQRGRTFFESDIVVVGETGVKPLALPAKLQLAGLVDDRLVIVSNQDWTAPNGTQVRAGSLIAFDAAALRDGRVPAPDILFVPSPRQSIDSVSVTAHHVIAPIYDNVRGQAWSFAHTGGGWSKNRLALPDNATVDVVSTDRHSDTAFLSVESFLTPLTLWQADLSSGALRQAKANPPRFDASGFVTEQHEVTSRDGTKVPYFITHRRDAKLDGSTPTLMTAYGGFQVSSTPAYLGVRGKLWLEHGGAFVLANIRGGGEFGPAWHEAGLNTKRQVVYDDFAAVGEDLVRRKLTSPRRLGIFGGSNGGLLMGVEMTQRPDLWHAVAIEIPLLDMLRYEQLSAGSSWVGEYGSVSDPAVRAFWEKTSPYQALHRDGHYPEPFIWTTTKDDRVGPVQARKFAARMKEYGLPYLFWENTEGGHAAGANLQQKARTQALETTYFARKLMD